MTSGGGADSFCTLWLFNEERIARHSTNPVQKYQEGIRYIPSECVDQSFPQMIDIQRDPLICRDNLPIL